MANRDEKKGDVHERSDEAAKAEFISACLALPGVRSVAERIPDEDVTQMLIEICDLIHCEDVELEEEMGIAH